MDSIVDQFWTPVDQDLCSDLFANATTRTEVDEEIENSSERTDAGVTIIFRETCVR